MHGSPNVVPLPPRLRQRLRPRQRQRQHPRPFSPPPPSGRPEATEDEIIEAAQRAQAYDFITRMPDGFSSQVGERGGHLSVGQRQRIGIARAFLKNAPILLLDEPTSALDATTEEAIMTVIGELMKGRTTLMVTHRLNTAHRFDRIVVLENGHIVEEGTGPDLLARGGAYAKMFTAGHYES